MFKDINDLLEKIPVWKELIALPKKVQELELKIKELEAKLEKSEGIFCPYCKSKDTEKQKNSFLENLDNSKNFLCKSCKCTFKLD